MSLPIATIDGDDLPVSFKYLPYVPKKRMSTRRTANAVVVQVASPTQIVHGDGIIPWTIEEARPEEFEDLFTLYNTDDLVAYDFIGYWNDYIEVYFTELHIERVYNRFMSLRGEFQVVALNSVYAPYTGISCAY